MLSIHLPRDLAAESHTICSSNAARKAPLTTHRSFLAGRRSIAKTLLALALTLLLLLVIADLALGHILGLGNTVLMQPDPGAVYVLTPNQHVRRFFKTTYINQHSMRSPEFSLVKPPGVYRVLLVGDSMTYGSTHIDQQAIFASLLRAELPAQLHQPVEILNASASAWAIGNEAGYLDSHGTFDADLVVLVLNTGDSLQPTATLGDVGGDAATVKQPCALCELWTRYLRDRIFHGAPKMDAGTAPTPDQMQNAAPNLLHLEHFYEVTRQHHARMAVVFLAMRQYIPAGAQASAPDKLVEWARQHDVPLVDTTVVESPFSIKGITLDGLHFNSKGHRVVASYLEQHWAQLDPARASSATP